MTTATQEVHSKGLYVNALNEILKNIENDPSNGRIQFDVKSDINGQSQIMSRVESIVPGSGKVRRKNTVISEEPFELSGGAQAFNPQELLLSALNSRLMLGYVMGAANRGITLDRLEINMQGELDLMSFLGWEEKTQSTLATIHFTVRLRGTGTVDEFKDIHKSVVHNAMTRFNLMGSASLSGTLIIE